MGGGGKEGHFPLGEIAICLFEETREEGREELWQALENLTEQRIALRFFPLSLSLPLLLPFLSCSFDRPVVLIDNLRGDWSNFDLISVSLTRAINIKLVID